MFSEYYQEKSNAPQRRTYYWQIMKRGFKRMTQKNEWLYFLLAIMVVQVVVAICINGYLNQSTGLERLKTVLRLITWCLISVVADVVYIFALGHPITVNKYCERMIKAKMINNASEPPVLIDLIHLKSGKYTGCDEMTFDSPGFSMKDWEDNQEKIESAFNRKILQIEQGATANTFKVVMAASGAILPEYIEWDDKYIDKINDAVYTLGIALPDRIITYDCDAEPMVAICGTTGSGKSTLVRSLIRQAIERDTKVILIDLKRGVDYGTYYTQNCTLLFNLEDINKVLKDTLIEMNDRFDEFRNIPGVTNIKEYRQAGKHMQRILVVIDELAQITDTRGASKEVKDLLDQINSSIIKISQQGRASGITLIVSGQRLDQYTFPGQLRSNINVKVCGKADQNLSIVVYGDSRADEKVPKHIQGRFMIEDGTMFQGFYLGK